MYMKRREENEILQRLPDLDKSVCMECGGEPRILWTAAKYGLILLCAGCAQVIGLQLLKDVRSYELDEKVSVRMHVDVVPK